MREFIKKFFAKEWSLYEKVLCLLLATVTGVLVGVVVSPVEQGISVFSNNGSHNKGNTSSVQGKEQPDKKQKNL